VSVYVVPFSSNPRPVEMPRFEAVGPVHSEWKREAAPRALVVQRSLRPDEPPLQPGRARAPRAHGVRIGYRLVAVSDLVTRRPRRVSDAAADEAVARSVKRR